MTEKEQKIAIFKGVVNDKSIRNRIRTSMGENAGAFIASMLDLYESENALQKCDPQKVAMECLKAASLNLPIVKGLGFAYVIPYKGTPTFIVGYKGLIQLALRSGQYRILNADAVYKGEEIRCDRISGKIDIVGTADGSKEAVGYFAYFQLINGFEKTIYMTVDEITEYARKYSPSFSSGSSPWKSEFDAMAKKTVLRQILKYGPMSTEMQELDRFEREQAVQTAARETRETIDIYANGEVIDTKELPAPNPAPVVDQMTGEINETVPVTTPDDFVTTPDDFGGPDF